MILARFQQIALSSKRFEGVARILQLCRRIWGELGGEVEGIYAIVEGLPAGFLQQVLWLPCYEGET